MEGIINWSINKNNLMEDRSVFDSIFCKEDILEEQYVDSISINKMYSAQGRQKINLKGEGHTLRKKITEEAKESRGLYLFMAVSSWLSNDKEMYETLRKIQPDFSDENSRSEPVQRIYLPEMKDFETQFYLEKAIDHSIEILSFKCLKYLVHNYEAASIQVKVYIVTISELLNNYLRASLEVSSKQKNIDLKLEKDLQNIIDIIKLLLQKRVILRYSRSGDQGIEKILHNCLTREMEELLYGNAPKQGLQVDGSEAEPIIDKDYSSKQCRGSTAGLNRMAESNKDDESMESVGFFVPLKKPNKTSGKSLKIHPSLKEKPSFKIDDDST